MISPGRAAGLLALVLGASSGIAFAEDDETGYSLSAMASAGQYFVDAERVQAANGFRFITRSEGDTRTFGGGLRFGVQSTDVFANFGIDYTDIDFFSITEVTAGIGSYLGDVLSWTVGVRGSAQGDGFADDKFYQELGYFFGLGAGGVNLWNKIGLSGSVAVNRSRLKLSSGGSANAPGISLGIKAGLLGTAHAVGLRYRKFDAETTNPVGTSVITDRIEEQYVMGYYEYSFFW